MLHLYLLEVVSVVSGNWEKNFFGSVAFFSSKVEGSVKPKNSFCGRR